jgi:hypothetical protein
MKVLKEDCEMAKKIQEVEDLLNKHGLRITTRSGMPLCITHGVIEMEIRMDGRECNEFPRRFDEERIVLVAS